MGAAISDGCTQFFLNKKRGYACIVEDFALPLHPLINMVDLAQLVRASDCGSEGRGFESHTPPFISGNSTEFSLFLCLYVRSLHSRECAFGEDRFWVLKNRGFLLFF